MTANLDLYCSYFTKLFIIIIIIIIIIIFMTWLIFVRVEVLRPSQPNRIMSSAVSLPNHTFTGQA